MSETVLPPIPGGSHLSEDACLDLAYGLLPAERRERALAHLRRCAACEDRVRLHAAERERLRIAGVPAAGAEAARAPVRLRDAGTAWRAWLPYAGAGLAAAAALLVVFVIRAPERPIPAGWLPPASDLMRIRGSGPTAEPELVAGLAAYARHDLPTAIAHLRTPVDDPRDDNFRKVYLGCALAASGSFREAADVLGQTVGFIDFIPDPWSGEARWSLYIALRGSGRRASADSLRRVLAAEPGLIGDRARGSGR